MFLETFKGRFETFFEWGFYAFIALFPFLIYEGHLFYGTSTRAINLFVFIDIFAIFLGVVLLSGRSKLSFAKSPITISLMILFLVSLISSISGVDFLTSFWSKAARTTGLFYFIHLGLFYFFFWMIFNKESKFRKFLSVFLISSGIFSVGAFLSKEGLEVIYNSKPWGGFTFGNSTFAGMYMLASFLLSIYFVYSLPKEKRSWWKKMLPIIFIINPFLLNREIWFGQINIFKNPGAIVGNAQASSYAMWFSVLFLLFIWIVFKIKSVKLRKGIMWGSIIVGSLTIVLAVFSLLSSDGYVREKYSNQATSARPIVWELSKNAIAERPLLGWGVDNFDVAFEKHYENKLLEQKNGGEAWFDRAHNIFIDQTIETGYIGMAAYILAYLTILVSLIYVLFTSKKREELGLASVLLTYFIAHIIELQTAFDTTISYVPVTFMAVSSAILFHNVYKNTTTKKIEIDFSKNFQYIFAVLIICSSLLLFFCGTKPLIISQNANSKARTVGSSEKRLPFYEKLFSAPLDQGTFIWRTSYDIQRGISLKPEIIGNPSKVAGFVEEYNIILEHYNKYLVEKPNDYRGRIQFSATAIYVRVFNEDHLNEAHTELDKAISIAPQAPQAYWMKAVAYLYQAKFDEAREWAKKGYDLNPNIEESKRVVDYVDKSIKDFPEIDLFAFKQI